MSRVELTHRFAVPLRDGFDYIVDPRNWPEYWPGLVRVEPGSRWQAPGDRARVVMRLLGRTVELEMTLRTFDPYRLVEYTSVQRGCPPRATNAALRTPATALTIASRWTSTRARGCAESSTAGSFAARLHVRCNARSPTSRQRLPAPRPATRRPE